MSGKLQDALAYPPRWMRAERAAAWVGMSRSKFLELVDDGEMPKPASKGGIKVWDRLKLDASMEDAEPDDEPKAPPPNSFDAVIAFSRKPK